LTTKTSFDALDDFEKVSDTDVDKKQKVTLERDSEKEILGQKLTNETEGAPHGAWTFNEKLATGWNAVAKILEDFTDENSLALDEIDKKVAADAGLSDTVKASKKVENNKARLAFAKLRNNASDLRYQSVEFNEENIRLADEILGDSTKKLGYVSRFGDASNVILDNLHADTTFVKPEDGEAYDWSSGDSKPEENDPADWEGRLTKLVTLAKDINSQRAHLATQISTKAKAIDDLVDEIFVNAAGGDTEKGYFTILEGDFTDNTVTANAVLKSADVDGEDDANTALETKALQGAIKQLSDLDEKYENVEKAMGYLQEVQTIRKRVGDAEFDAAPETAYYLYDVKKLKDDKTKIVIGESDITNNNVMNTLVSDVADKLYNTAKPNGTVSFSVGIMESLFKKAIPDSDVYNNSGSEDFKIGEISDITDYKLVPDVDPVTALNEVFVKVHTDEKLHETEENGVKTKFADALENDGEEVDRDHVELPKESKDTHDIKNYKGSKAVRDYLEKTSLNQEIFKEVLKNKVDAFVLVTKRRDSNKAAEDAVPADATWPQGVDKPSEADDTTLASMESDLKRYEYVFGVQDLYLADYKAEAAKVLETADIENFDKASNLYEVAKQTARNTQELAKLMLPVYQYELKTKVDIVKGAMNQENEDAADEKENALIAIEAKIDAQKVNIADLNKLILKNQQDKCKMLRTNTDNSDKIQTIGNALTNLTKFNNWPDFILCGVYYHYFDKFVGEDVMYSTSRYGDQKSEIIFTVDGEIKEIHTGAKTEVSAGCEGKSISA